MIICEEDKCCACGLCAEICPKNSIQLKLNTSGFYYPTIDGESCIECGQCKLYCPQNSEDTTNSILKTYVGYSMDRELLQKSTSGGIIGELYQKILEQGGYVAGVKWDNAKSCSFLLTNLREEMQEFHGSKYIGVKLKNIYNQVKEKLDLGFYVMFVGTPCQCAALKKYLRKNYEKLLLVDFICHGVSSNLVLEKYIDFLESGGYRVKQYTMRSKKNGYSAKLSQITYQEKESLIESFYKSTFGYPFASNLSVREGCLQCRYASTNRISDITVADWMVDLSEEEQKSGASLIVVNTDKGINIIRRLCEEKKIILKDISLEKAIQNCYRLSHKSDIPKYREKYLSDLKKDKNIEKLTKYYIRKSNCIVARLCRKLKHLVKISKGVLYKQ